MTRRKDPPGYSERVIRLAQKLITNGVIGAGGIIHTVVKHDDWCSALSGKSSGICTCYPDIEVRDHSGKLLYVEKGREHD
jgi:hypothetical protein